MNLDAQPQAPPRRTLLTDLVRAVAYARWCRQVRRLVAMAPEELEQFRLGRLRTVLAHAYENVELYRCKWRQAGVRPDDLETPMDLAKFPVVTKDDFRRYFPDGILSRSFRRQDCHLVGTSGSTGSPVSLFIDTDKALFDFAINLPQIMVGHRPITVVSGVRDFLWRRRIRHLFIVVDESRAYESLHGRVFPEMRHTVVNSLVSTSEHVEALNRKRPEFVMTYPSVLRNLCLEVRASGRAIHQPKVIMLVGEMFDESLRKLAGQVFHAVLMDVYASTEVGFIAAECPERRGMHLLTWKVLVELLDDNGREVAPGRTGRVVVTDLFNRATPLIRYCGLGDYASRSQESCPCGRLLPLLTHIDGRWVDSIVCPDGRIVHPYRLTLALEDVPHLARFQIRQEQADHIRVLLVKESVSQAAKVSFAPDSEWGRIILERFARILDSPIEVELEMVDDIPRRPGSHKHPTVLSLLSQAEGPDTTR